VLGALLDLTMKRFLETLILRSEFSEIIAPFSNAVLDTISGWGDGDDGILNFCRSFLVVR
jgi:hypothetical protein